MQNVTNVERARNKTSSSIKEIPTTRFRPEKNYQTGECEIRSNKEIKYLWVGRRRHYTNT